MFENRTEPGFVALSSDEPKTLSLRNLLVAWSKHIATEAVNARANGNKSDMIDFFFLEALDAARLSISTDVASLAHLILRADYVLQLTEYLAKDPTASYQKETEKQISETLAASDALDDSTVAELVAQGAEYSSDARREKFGETVFGLQETILAILKGCASNALVAVSLAKKARPKREFEGQGLRSRAKEMRPRDKKDKDARDALLAEADKIEAETTAWREKERAAIDGIIELLAFLATDPADVDALIDALNKAGNLAATSLEIAELGTYQTYGTPAPTSVRASAAPGRCALFSGDDLDALLEFMDRAEFSDVNVWTRGDAIAAHSLPAFKKYRRLVGCYGGSWRDQQKELGAFPGGILVSSTPFDEPDDSYSDYVFSDKPTRWENVATIPRKEDGSRDFNSVVTASFDSPGFSKMKPNERIAIGFGGEGMAGIVDKTARAFRQGSIKRLFVLCGQDVATASENYFERLFDALPEDSSALTFGDVKFRFNRKPMAPTSYGAPRLVDLGRERDAAAALRFADQYGEELGRQGEMAPIAFFVSLWGEASLAVAFAFSARGYRNVFIGPRAPKYWTTEIVQLLRERLGILITDEPENDVQRALTR